MGWDSDKACVRASRMWLKIGRVFEELAVNDANDPDTRRRAIELAAMADCCFWHATGEGDVFSLKQFMPEGGPDSEDAQ